MTGLQEILASIKELDSAGRSRACGDYVQAARDAVRQGHASGEQPAELLQGLSTAFDRLVQALFEGASLAPTTLLSLVALGGYGRSELYPHSDLDLLILYDKGEDALATRVVEAVIYPLWDARVSVGHAVRSQQQTLDLAAEDLTVRTSLLDARVLAGDPGPYHALNAAAIREFFGPDVGQFVAALKQERAQRHRRFGETIYLLEPNIKSCKGGLRDLNTGLWAAKARLGVEHLDQVERSGGTTARQARALLQAQRFLADLRLHMHLHAGRTQDQLSFELQEALAPRIFPPEQLIAGQRRTDAPTETAVEQLMHAFYRHAQAVVLETDGLMERLALMDQQAPAVEQPASDREGEHLMLAGRRIHSVDPQRFWQQPVEMLYALKAAREHSRSLDRPTRDAVAEAAAGAPGMQLRADAEAAEVFMELLCDPGPEQSAGLLAQAHELGLVAAVVPEFEPCTGRVQHDLYHVYTVDRHSLYVVAQLKAWRRGEQAEQHPTAVAAMAEVQRPQSLMLAALLHDVAKPLGHGHAERGARLAAGVAARLDLTTQQQQQVRALVRDHLVMAHVSQRRDLADPMVISKLASLVGTVAQLRRLYLLTLADTAMTAPGNLTDWKERLLDQLYFQTLVHLIKGESGARQERQDELRDRRDALRIQLRRGWGEAGEALLESLPADMVLQLPAGELMHHLAAVLTPGDDAPAGGAVRLLTRPAGPASTTLTISCADSPGRLAQITGVMTAHRIEVLGAQVYTLERGADAASTAGSVLDIFSVRTPQRPRQVWPAFSRDLERAVSGELQVAELVARHTRPCGLPPRIIPHVPVEVSLENKVSERFTVVEVQAPDRLGVLHAITRALSEQGLEIHLSRVATEAGRVVDIFYVSDRETGDKVQPAAMEQVRGAVGRAVEALKNGD